MQCSESLYWQNKVETVLFYIYSRTCAIRHLSFQQDSRTCAIRHLSFQQDSRTCAIRHLSFQQDSRTCAIRDTWVFQHPVTSDKIDGSKEFLLTKIKPEYSDILYNPTHFPGPLVCRIKTDSIVYKLIYLIRFIMAV